MTAVLHHIKVVYWSFALLCLEYRLNNRLFGVVNQYENVGKLNGSTASYAQTRRNTLNYSTLGCTNECFCALIIVVVFKVECKNKAES